MKRNRLTLFFKTILYCFSFHCLSLQAETFSQSLNQAEKLTYQNINTAEKLIDSLSLQLPSASNNEKLKWLITSLNISILNHNNHAVEALKAKIPLLIRGSDKKSHHWRQLLSVYVALTLTPSSPKILNELQVLETEILLYKDAFLSAYFYRTLYYALMNQDIIDVGLDIAIKNIKQWQKLEEYYFSLEMQLNIATIRITILSDKENAEQLLIALGKEVKSLEASRYLVSIEVLKASILGINNEFKQSYTLLESLLANPTFTLSAHQKTGIHSNLAFLSFELKDYKQAIYFSRKVLNYTKKHAHKFIAASQVQLAKALLEVQQYQEATQLLAEAKVSFLQKNDRYGLFDVDNLNVDILYKDNDIAGLYRTAKSLIANITSPGTNLANVSQRRITRAENAAHVEEQSIVVESLAQDNISQQKELTLSKEVLVKKNQFLVMLSLLCIIFISLLVWVYSLLKRVKVLANTDSLTGINNRRYGIELSEKKFRKHMNSPTIKSFSVVMMDLDHFKNINDSYGHDIGDKVIQLTVNLALKELSPQDIFCRMGGEEFMFVLIGSNRQEILTKVENIRQNIYQFDTSPLGISKAVSASFGLSFIKNSEKNHQQAFAIYIIEADTALYAAKKSGRNQLSTYQQ
ncbi:MAG: GGDEF domain-containing protein [Colwellia sp.]|nr:GGDEF domain-containing protein [Colwellia sp.]